MKLCKFKRFIAINIALYLLLSVTHLSYGEGHWAQTEMEYLLSKGIVSGYPDGTLRPDNPITRAEFVKIINNVIGSFGVADLSFKDVSKTDWFYDEVAKAIKSEYVEGYGDNTFRPNSQITREEAVKIIVAAFGLEDEDLSKGSSFADDNKISSWAKEYVSILKNKKYIAGYSDGTFRPRNPITRAEAMKIITNVSGHIININGEYSKNAEGNVLVNTSGVILKDMHIRGDLYLTVGIGKGGVVLDNVTVDGTVYITGGGADGILIKDSNVKETVINNKVDESVHVVLDNSKASSVFIKKGANFTAKKGTLIGSIIVAGKNLLRIEKEVKIDKVQVDSNGIEMIVHGDIETLIANEHFILNGQKITKGARFSLKDGRTPGTKRDEKVSHREDEHRDDKDDKDDEDGVINYQLIAELDKGEYSINESITLTGKVLKNNVGLAGIDITLKLGDIPITVEQLKTDEMGQFTLEFTVPETTKEGEYNLIVKANEPVNMVKELNMKLLKPEEKYKINAELNKEKYFLNESIIINGQVLEENAGFSNVDITIQLKDYGREEIITVGQLKTDEVGSFSYSFKVPEATKSGIYKLIIKANEPLNDFLEFTIEIIDG